MSTTTSTSATSTSSSSKTSQSILEKRGSRSSQKVAKGNGTASAWLEQLAARKEWSPSTCRLSKRNVCNLLKMIRLLLENGLSLQRSLETLTNDRACRKHKKLISTISSKVSSGESFSRAMSAFPLVFTTTMVHHVALAEASGSLIESLDRISQNLEETLELRRKLVQKLSYPALVITAGSGLVGFMLTTVVPQFEKIYSESNVDLPWVTSFITGLSRFATSYLWLLPVIAIAIYLTIRGLRKNATMSIKLDALLLRVPVLGDFIADFSALEYLRSTLVMTEAGFVPLDAITQAAKSVPNRYAKQLLTRAALDVQRGQKISKAIQPCEFLFPSAVLQLIAIGEQTGGLAHSCVGSVQLVKSRLEARMTAMLGIIEPALTISLAACIGWIVLAIYMPMFHMFDVLEY